jgi:hypothetical protein
MDPIEFLMEHGAPKANAKPSDLQMAVLRELDAGDARDILDPPSGAVPSVVKIRARHHTIARLVAEGRRANEVAAIVGCGASHVHTLNADPAFQDLVEHYRTQVTEIYLGAHVKLAHLADQAVGELQERLEAAPKTFGNRELKEIAEMALDRTGFAPKGASGGVNGAGKAPLSGLKIQFINGDGTGVTIEGTADE